MYFIPTYIKKEKSKVYTQIKLNEKSIEPTIELEAKLIVRSLQDIEI